MKITKNILIGFMFIIAYLIIVQIASAGPFRVDENIEMGDNDIYNASDVNSSNFWQNDFRVLDTNSTINTSNINQSDLNVNSSTWWNDVSGWLSRWFYKSGDNLEFNETLLSQAIKNNVSDANDTMKIYVDIEDANLRTNIESNISALNESINASIVSTNESMKAYVDDANNSQTIYIDSQDDIYNDSMKDYVDSTNSSMKNYVDTQDDTYNDSMITYVTNVQDNDSIIRALNTTWIDTFVKTMSWFSTYWSKDNTTDYLGGEDANASILRTLNMSDIRETNWNDVNDSLVLDNDSIVRALNTSWFENLYYNIITRWNKENASDQLSINMSDIRETTWDDTNDSVVLDNGSIIRANITNNANLSISGNINYGSANGGTISATDGNFSGDVKIEGNLTVVKNVSASYFLGKTVTPILHDDLVPKTYVDDAVSSTAFDFFFNDQPSNIGNHFNMTENDLDLPETTLTSVSLGATGIFSIFNWTTLIGQPEFNELRKGVYDVHIHLEKSGSRSIIITSKLYNISADGSERNLLVTFETSSELTSDTTQFDLHGVSINNTMLNDGDRLNLELEATVGAGGPTTVIVTLEGTTDSHMSIETSTNAFEKIYIRRDGTNQLTGNWDAGSFDITAQSFIGSGSDLTGVQKIDDIWNLEDNDTSAILAQLSLNITGGTFIIPANESWAIEKVNDSIKDYYNKSLLIHTQAVGGEVSGTIGSITLSNTALDDQYQRLANAFDYANNVTHNDSLINRGNTSWTNSSLSPDDWQLRVTGTCAAGSSIRIIDNAGQVTCETDDAGGETTNSTSWNNTGTAIVTANQELDVGIGTSNPGEKLEVYSATTNPKIEVNSGSVNYDPYFQLSTLGTPYSYWYRDSSTGQVYLTTVQSQADFIFTLNKGYFVFDKGNVNITGALNVGNVSINENLSVRGNVSFNQLKNCDTIDTDANGLFTCGSDAGGGIDPTAWNLDNNDTSATLTQLSLNITGGTFLTPINLSDISRYVNQTSNASLYLLISDVVAAGTINSTSWNNTGTAIVTANQELNVGIGTITPAHELHVIGNINITGSVNATKIQSNIFIGPLTGNADTATLAATSTVIDGTDTSSFVAIFDTDSGSLPIKTDGGLTYNAGTADLAATTFSGALDGNAGTATLAADATTLATPRNIGGVSFDGSAPITPTTIAVTDTADATSYIGIWESASGNLLPQTDGGILYNAVTGNLSVGSIKSLDCITFSSGGKIGSGC